MLFGDDGSQIESVMVDWQQVFLALLVFALVVVQLEDSAGYIDSYSLPSADEFGRIVAAFLWIGRYSQ